MGSSLFFWGNASRNSKIKAMETNKLCECGCGKSAPLATNNNTRFGHVKGMSMRFIRGHAARRPQLDRFLKKIKKTPTCWLWQAGQTMAGYGSFDQTMAHRVSYRLFKGPLAKGEILMHSCDTPLCVNPDHLSIGTTQENTADSVRKMRRPSGEKNNKAKLTELKVAAIRAAYIPGYGGYGCRKLAQQFGVTKPTIQRILRGQTWRASSAQA